MNVIFIITDKDLGWEQKNFEIKKTRKKYIEIERNMEKCKRNLQASCFTWFTNYLKCGNAEELPDDYLTDS